MLSTSCTTGPLPKLPLTNDCEWKLWNPLQIRVWSFWNPMIRQCEFGTMVWCQEVNLSFPYFSQVLVFPNPKFSSQINPGGKPLSFLYFSSGHISMTFHQHLFQSRFFYLYIPTTIDELNTIFSMLFVRAHASNTLVAPLTSKSTILSYSKAHQDTH